VKEKGVVTRVQMRRGEWEGGRHMLIETEVCKCTIGVEGRKEGRRKERTEVDLRERNIYAVKESAVF
jgi:hypothetical protein